MSSGGQPPERVGEVGPIELTSGLGPGDDTGDTGDTGPDDTAVWGSAPGGLERRVGAWWQSLPQRRRRTGSALVALAVVAAVAVPALDHRTPQPPPPLPNDVTDVQFLGISTGGGQSPDDFTVSVRVSDLDSSPLTVRQVTQGYPGVSLSVTPELPRTARPGRPVTLTLRATVHDCALVTPNDPYPVLIVTVSNSRATQTQSDALGDPYILDMHGALLRACGGTAGFGGPFPRSAADSGIFPP